MMLLYVMNSSYELMFSREVINATGMNEFILLEQAGM